MTVHECCCRQEIDAVAVRVMDDGVAVAPQKASQALCSPRSRADDGIVGTVDLAGLSSGRPVPCGDRRWAASIRIEERMTPSCPRQASGRPAT